jgi:hypothetical protein
VASWGFRTARATLFDTYFQLGGALGDSSAPVESMRAQADPPPSDGLDTGWMLEVFRDSGFTVARTWADPGTIVAELPTSLSPEALDRFLCHDRPVS